METTRDEELLDAWSRGDTRAGNLLVQRHFDLVYRFLVARTGESAADLVQQTFLACVERRARVADVVSFKAFLLGIAREHMLSHLHGSAHRKQVYEGMFRNQTSSDRILPSPSYGAAVEEEQRMLSRAISRLPIDLQISLELYYWEEMSTAEIADVLVVPRGTIMNRLFRARQRIRKTLDELERDPTVTTSTLRGLDTWARSMRQNLWPTGRLEEPPPT